MLYILKSYKTKRALKNKFSELNKLYYKYSSFYYYTIINTPTS